MLHPVAKSTSICVLENVSMNIRIIFAIMLSILGLGQATRCQNNLFQLIYSIDNKQLSKILVKVHANYFRPPMCLDSLEGQLVVGALVYTGEEAAGNEISHIDSTMVLFVNRSGDIVRSRGWLHDPKWLIPYPRTFRSIKGKTYLVGNNQRGLRVDSAAGYHVITPWHPDRARALYPSYSLAYTPDAFSGVQPLFLIQTNGVLSIGADSVLRKYDENGKVAFSRKIDLPKLQPNTQPSDRMIGTNYSQLYLYDAPTTLIKIDLADRHTESIEIDDELKRLCGSAIVGEAEASGISLYVWKDVPYFIVNAEKGIFVFRLLF